MPLGNQKRHCLEILNFRALQPCSFGLHKCGSPSPGAAGSGVCYLGLGFAFSSAGEVRVSSTAEPSPIQVGLMRKRSGIALWGVPLLSRKLREQPKTQVLKSEPGAPAVSLYFNFRWRGAILDAWGQRKFRNSTQATRPRRILSR